MKILIFGATGKIGLNLVDQALQLGHQVTAFVRNPQKFNRSHSNLRLVQGDVLDLPFVVKAVEGQDVIITALGRPLLDKSNLRSKGTRNIIQAMEQVGVKRMICLSGLGVGDSFDVLPFYYKYLILPLVFRRIYADHALQEGYVRSSALDWVIARPGNFVKGTHTGKYRHGITPKDPSPTLKISHQDVADFMLKQLQENTYLHKAAAISY